MSIHLETDLIIKRSKVLGVGKQLSNTVWFHRLYLEEIMSRHKVIIDGHSVSHVDIESLALNFPFDLCKWNIKTGELTLLSVPMFNIEQEPEVHASFNVSTNKINRFTNNRQIYHRRELMVKESYKGFCVEHAQQRTQPWVSLAPKDPRFYLSIGRKRFWVNWLHSVGLEP
ncbi:hypothetical protein I3271_04460 [Photobacterium leiognathi]|uniref:hypothetical protein n=1 Tax=Photobacterium leiognathi TaxID=553611 RepID=UPI001EDECF68|nr:hypothetical protein [Photobacterium leiognathi]MCG3883938.1 hypothetical protein [Photobacterium leiognathi]